MDPYRGSKDDEQPVLAATRRPTFTPTTSSSSVPQFAEHRDPSSSGHTPTSSNSPREESPYTETEAHHVDIQQPTPPPPPPPSQPTPQSYRESITMDSFSHPFDLSGASTGYDPHRQDDEDIQMGASIFPGRETQHHQQPQQQQQPIQILRSPGSPKANRRSSSPFRGNEGQTSIALASVGMLGAGTGYTNVNVPPPPPLPTFDKDYNVVRKPSMAKRLIGGLGRMRTAHRKSLTAESNYSKLDENDEDEYNVPIDVSTYHPDFTPASSSIKAGLQVPADRHLKFLPEQHASADDISNLDSSYLGKGISYDLSDDISLYSRKTGFNTELVLPVDPDPPNWKPHELRLPYMMFLNLVNLGLLGSMEYLIQQSSHLGTQGILSFDDPKELSLFHYFCWKYLPTMIGVVYGILWELTDTEVKRIEPYFQMTKPEGAIAKNSLNVEYFSFWNFLAPVQAVRYAQWAVLLSSVCSVLAYAVTPNLLSVVLDVEEDDVNKHRKYIVVDNRYARPLEVIFSVISIMSIILTWGLWRRKTGLVGDVSGIAGIAAMANKSHILNDFQDLDEASAKRIHYHLSRRRYRLHRMSLYLGDKVDKAEQEIYKEPKFLLFFGKYRNTNNNPPIITLQLGLPFMFLLLFILVAISLIAYLPQAIVVVQHFPFFATGLGILIKSIWEVLDKELRVLQPFYDLYKGNAPPETLTLDYTGSILGVIVFKALRRKHWLLALVTFMSVLIEILTVTMGAFLNRYREREETPLSIRVSFALAMVIMVSLIFTQGLVIYRRRHVFLPRQPGTIASVLTFIHQSKMVTDFQDMELWTTKEREKKLVSLGKRYGFGWFTGRDRAVHLGIDEEPMRGKYVHGKDYRAGVVDRFVDIDVL